MDLLLLILRYLFGDMSLHGGRYQPLAVYRDGRVGSGRLDKLRTAEADEADWGWGQFQVLWRWGRCSFFRRTVNCLRRWWCPGRDSKSSLEL